MAVECTPSDRTGGGLSQAPLAILRNSFGGRNFRPECGSTSSPSSSHEGSTAITVLAPAPMTFRAQSPSSVLTKASNMPLLSGERTGVEASLRPSAVAARAVSLAMEALPLSRSHSTKSGVFVPPKRRSTASIMRSRTIAPVTPAWATAAQAMISRSQASIPKSARTMSPLRQSSSRWSDHQRILGFRAMTMPLLRAITPRTVLAEASLTIALALIPWRAIPGLPAMVEADALGEHRISMPVNLRKRGVKQKLIVSGPVPPAVHRDEALIKAIAHAHIWFEDLKEGRVADLAAIARRETLAPSYVQAHLPLACLAPSIVAVILIGGIRSTST